MIAYQFSIIENANVYTVKCDKCRKAFQTKISTDIICPSCMAGLKYNKPHELSSLPERKELSAEEFATCVGRMLRAMIGEASETIANGKQQEKAEAVYFLKGGGIEDWIHFVGLEYSRQIKQLVDKAATGEYQEF